MYRILTNYFQVKPTNNLSGRNKLYLCLAIFWTLFIAVLCLESSSDLPNLGISVSNVDKYVHFIFHFVFTVLWFLYWKTRNGISVFKIFIASLLYGIAIEVAQGVFTTTRTADVADVLANVCGSITAVIAIVLSNKFLNKKI